MQANDIFRRVSHHRSISQLLENLADRRSEMGLSNPALNTDDNNENGDIRTHGMELATVNDGHHFPGLSCFNNNLSPDSEYDEELAIPDSMTIISMKGGQSMLVPRQENDDTDESITSDIEIRFTTIYDPQLNFTSCQRKVFIPNVEIYAQIIDTDRSVTTHLLNPNLYTIQLTHGPFQWTIKKRYKHFSALHQQLRVYRLSLGIPLPSRSHKERRASFRNNYPKESITVTSNNHESGEGKDEVDRRRGKKKKRKGALPRFPNRPESLVAVEHLPDRIQQLEEYLNNLLNISLYCNHHETVNFLEVSQLSFIAGLGEKGREGPIMKRTGSTRPGQAGCNCFGMLHNSCCVRCNYFCSDIVCGKWRNRWFFVKETFFGYIRPKDGMIRCVVLFDQGFDLSSGIYSTGLRNGLQIVTNNRHMILKTWTRRKAKEWMTYLKQVSNNTARDFTLPNQHTSFAPQRSSILAGWFVDGANYMNKVADALESAIEEIYIADWWLSPEIYMKRPALDGDYWRLDQILKRKASEGVRIFILLYKEVEIALGINSYYSKQKLLLHENIKVIRHPDHAKIGVFFWAHHEKIVVIDQTYAFLGGIDLCYGRWDNYRHSLTDLGSINTNGSACATSSPIKIESTKKKAAQEPYEFGNISNIQKKLPELKPGDKLIMPKQTSKEEPYAENTKRDTPELERKNILSKFKEINRKGKDVMHRITSFDGVQAESSTDKKLVFSDKEIEEGAKGGLESPEIHTQEIDGLHGDAKYWIGKDYTNFILKDFVNLDAPFADLVDRQVTPRMPWHDIGAVVVGSAARDVARHFIQRWNATKLEKARENPSFPYLMPKSYLEIKNYDRFLTVPLERVTCQVLRSAASWSCGFIEQDSVEQSIHEAYIQTITKAQHYIYIENQFFISLEMGNPNVRNQIAETIFKRIIRAYREGKTFRVFIVLPLLPGFEGDVGGATGTAVRAITHWNYASICRGKYSLIQRLRDAGVKDPTEYISFHCLRNHANLNGSFVTELIYVHSKLLIADDKVVICGSANINDRSLIGKRDSEIAVLITDEEYTEGKMNGEHYPCGAYAGKLRKYLFREHLGLLEPNPNRPSIDINDPVIDGFWNGVWRRASTQNTRIYEECFKCIPTDAVTSFVTLKKYLETPPLCKSNPEATATELKRIQGHLVDLPLYFLQLEVLTPPSTTKEGLIPTSVWT